MTYLGYVIDLVWSLLEIPNFSDYVCNLKYLYNTET